MQPWLTLILCVNQANLEHTELCLPLTPEGLCHHTWAEFHFFIRMNVVSLNDDTMLSVYASV